MFAFHWGHLRAPCGRSSADSVVKRLNSKAKPTPSPYYFGPSGLAFPDDARPTLVYNSRSGGLPPQVDPHNLSIVYLDGLQLLEVLPTAYNAQTGVVQANLKHFSTYALATD